MPVNLSKASRNRKKGSVIADERIMGITYDGKRRVGIVVVDRNILFGILGDGQRMRQFDRRLRLPGAAHTKFDSGADAASARLSMSAMMSLGDGCEV